MLFLVQGCSCDQQLLNLLPMVNVSPAQIQFGACISSMPYVRSIFVAPGTGCLYRTYNSFAPSRH